MTGQLIDGKKIANSLRVSIQDAIARTISPTQRKPGLAFILVGNNPASEIYVRHKRSACEEVGIQSFFHRLPENTSEKSLRELILALNLDSLVDGILIQSPLPEQINPE